VKFCAVITTNNLVICQNCQKLRPKFLISPNYIFLVITFAVYEYDQFEKIRNQEHRIISKNVMFDTELIN